MRVCLLWLCGLVAAFACIPRPALAQPWLSDRARAEGRGITVGSLVLHPGIGAETGYDSNVFLSESPEDSVVVRIGPHLYLATQDAAGPSGERALVSFRGGVSGSLRHYFATNAGTSIGIGEDAKLRLAPSTIFAIEFFDDYTRSVLPFTDPGILTPGSAAPHLDFGRDKLGVGTRLQLSTRSSLLKVGLGYRLDLDFFESKSFDANDAVGHTISADTSWQFLPKTAVVWQSNFKLRKFSNATSPGVGERNGSKEIDSRLGLNGALTERIGFTIGAGYGAGFYDDDSTYENLLAQVEARYRLSDVSQLKVGYDRTTNPSYQGNYMNSNRVKAGVEAMIGGVAVVGAKAELTFVSFGHDDKIMRARSDRDLLLNLNGEYRFADWFAVTAELGYSRNDTDFSYPAMDANSPDDPAKYSRFEGWLGVRAFM